MPIDIPGGDELLQRTDAIDAGLDALQELAQQRAPKLSGRLAQSIQKRRTSASSGQIYTRLIYAPKQERRGWQKHPHGGQAHYMATAMVDGADEAMNRIAAQLFQE